MISSYGINPSYALSYYMKAGNDQIAKSLERLSSGSRINSPSDDVGAYFTASNYERRGNSSAMIAQNLEENIAALKSLYDNLTEIKDLLTQAADYALKATTEDDNAIRRSHADEAEKLLVQIDTLVNTSTFNANNYLSSTQSITVQIDEGSSSTLTYTIIDSSREVATGLNIYAPYHDPVSKWGGFNSDAVDKANAALDYQAWTSSRTDNSTGSGLVNIDRNIARTSTNLLMLESRQKSLENKAANYEASREKLTAVDDAAEQTALTSSQIRQQASAYFLAQHGMQQRSLMGFFFQG